MLGVCRASSQGHCSPIGARVFLTLPVDRHRCALIDCLLTNCVFVFYAGLLAPTLVQFEQEIDQELEKDQQESMTKRTLLPPTDVSALLGDSELIFDDTPQPQITNNDLESLHEKVSSILLINYTVLNSPPLGCQSALSLHLSCAVLLGTSLRGKVPNRWYSNAHFRSGKCKNTLFNLIFLTN